MNRAVQNYNKQQYDKRHKKLTQYREGDLVAIRVLQHKPGVNQKLTSKYSGPYRIKNVLRKNRYMVMDVPEFDLTPPLNTILSANKIKPWIRVGSEPPNLKINANLATNHKADLE